MAASESGSPSWPFDDPPKRTSMLGSADEINLGLLKSQAGDRTLVEAQDTLGCLGRTPMTRSRRMDSARLFPQDA